MNISTVISYCSLDQRFIRALLEQVKFFSNDIIVVYYDKLMNGKSEPIEEIETYIKNFDSNIQTVCLPFSDDKSSKYYHNLARWRGKDLAKNDYILFLDGDEIPDGSLMKSFLDNNPSLLTDYDAVDFKCYWYFRSANNQALQTEECGMLVNKNVISETVIFNDLERWNFKHQPNIRSISRVQPQEGPIFNHFSWVRTKEEMLDKVSSWAHKHDRDWKKLIEQEFSREFNGTDFVHRYSYRQVEDRFRLGI